MTETPHICSLIDRQIKALGIPAKQFAADMGVSDATVSQWRRFKSPAASKWPDICRYLQIDLREILQDEGTSMSAASACHAPTPVQGSTTFMPQALREQDRSRTMDIYDERIQDMRQALERADRRNERLEDRLERMERRMDDLLQTVQTLQAEKTDLVQKMSALSTENMALKTEVLTLKTELSHPSTPQSAVGE